MWNFPFMNCYIILPHKSCNCSPDLPDDCDDNEEVADSSNDGNKPVQDEENDLDFGDEDDLLIYCCVAFIIGTVRVVVGVIHPIILNLSHFFTCLLYTSPSPRDLSTSRMPSSA